MSYIVLNNKHDIKYQNWRDSQFDKYANVHKVIYFDTANADRI